MAQFRRRGLVHRVVNPIALTRPGSAEIRQAGRNPDLSTPENEAAATRYLAPSPSAGQPALLKGRRSTGTREAGCTLPQMVVPLAVRIVAAVVGGLLVLTSVSSVTGTMIVSRPVGSWLTRWVDRTVDGVYQMVTAHHRRPAARPDPRQPGGGDPAGPAGGWLVVAYVGFALLLWPFAARGVVSAFTTPGPRCSPGLRRALPGRCRP